MTDLPRFAQAAMLCAGLTTAFFFSACSNGDDPEPSGSGGGASMNTGGNASTGGAAPVGSGGEGSTACLPKDGEYEFCSPICTCPPDVTGVDLTTEVSFRADLYPSLPTSCGEDSFCHASDTPTGYDFGTPDEPLTDAEITALIAQLKTPSPVANIPNVVPNNWEGSYLMMKLDGCQNNMGLSCNSDAPSLMSAACTVECDKIICDSLPCGDAMPPSTPDDNLTADYPVSEELRNKFRAWIAQGAQDN